MTDNEYAMHACHSNIVERTYKYRIQTVNTVNNCIIRKFEINS